MSGKIGWRRTRLLASLAEVADGGVVVVVAPAGAGKTTLLEQWRAEQPEHRRIVGVEKLSSDVDRFGKAVIAAVAEMIPLPDPIVRLAAGADADWACEVVPALLAALDGATIGLALDDVHLLPPGPCLELVRALAADWPEHGVLLLSGRRRPQIALLRTRFGQPVRTIRERDLEFDLDEIAAIAAEVGDPEQARELMARTGGWPAGVRLLALDRRRAGGSKRSQRTDVADYLRAEVVAEFAEDEIGLLGAIAALSPAPVRLLQTMLHRDDVAEIVGDAQARGLPMVHCSETPDMTVAVHSLLVDVLVALVEECRPGHLDDVFAEAVVAAEAQREYHSAFLVQARRGEQSELAAMCYRHMGHLVMNGQSSVLRAWLESFTADEIRSDPALSIAVTHTMRPRLEGVVEASLQHHDADESTVLPDGSTPHDAIRRLRLAFGFTGCTVEELEVRGGWRHTNTNRYSWQLYAEDRAEEAQALLAEFEPHAGRYSITHAMLQARLSILAFERGELDVAQERADRAVAALHDGGLDDGDGAYFVDAALIKLARARSDLDGAATLAARMRTKIAMIGDGTKLERLTALIECAELYLEIGHAAQDIRGISDEARSIVASWGHVPRFERDLDRLDLRLARAPVHRGRVRGDLALTNAELRVLRYLPSHHTFPEIAGLLYLSTNTVKSHRNSIYRKLRVSGRSDAVDAAVARGLLSGALEP